MPIVAKRKFRVFPTGRNKPEQINSTIRRTCPDLTGVEIGLYYLCNRYKLHHLHNWNSSKRNFTSLFPMDVTKLALCFVAFGLHWEGIFFAAFNSEIIYSKRQNEFLPSYFSFKTYIGSELTARYYFLFLFTSLTTSQISNTRMIRPKIHPIPYP